MDGDANQKHLQTENSLNRSQSYPSMPKDQADGAGKPNERSGDIEDDASQMADSQDG
jgi:hypothetical protein